eukprot:gene8636-9346_t
MVIPLFVLIVFFQFFSDTLCEEHLYRPTDIVRQSHKILHLDKHLQLVSNDFKSSDLLEENDYYRSLLPIPLICAALGILALFILQIFLILRVFIKSLRFLPEVHVSGQKSLSLLKYSIDPRILLAFKFIILIVVAVVDNIVVFGNIYLAQGVDSAKDSIGSISSNFSLLLNQGYSLNSTGASLQYDLYSASSSCNNAHDLAIDMSSNFFPYTNSYINYVAPLPGHCNDLEDGIEKWGEAYKRMWYKNRQVVRYSIGLGEIIMAITFVMIAIEMVIVMGLADFCMDPTTNIDGLIPKEIYNVSSYYLNCQGEGPLNSSLISLQTFSNQYSNKIQVLLDTTCQGNINLQTSLEELHTINTTLYDTGIYAACPPIQNHIEDILEDSLCDNGFQGIYVIWLGQYVTNSCVLLTTIVLSYLYQYFGAELFTEALENDNQSGHKYEIIDEEAGEKDEKLSSSMIMYAVTSTISPKKEEKKEDNGNNNCTEEMETILIEEKKLGKEDDEGEEEDGREEKDEREEKEDEEKAVVSFTNEEEINI